MIRKQDFFRRLYDTVLTFLKVNRALSNRSLSDERLRTGIHIV